MKQKKVIDLCFSYNNIFKKRRVLYNKEVMYMACNIQKKKLCYNNSCSLGEKKK